MSLSGISFLCIYFPILFIGYYNPVFKSRKFKNIILLLASLGLYAFAEPVYILLLVGSILFNFIFAKIERKTGSRFWGYFAIIIDVLVLIFFKYINRALSFGLFSDYSMLRIAFPIGLSYFTFREISFILESRKDDCHDAGLLDVALYISNFMCINAGPLGFYDTEIAQIKNREETKEKVFKGIKRFVTGLIKKIIIADIMLSLVIICFAQDSLSVVMAWAGAIGYTLVIFFDFSGYTDMAIGVGNIFGFELQENFALPYTAASVSDFWKRWHMSLTKWFTRYIYIPLGGSRVNSKARHLFNLWVVWLCTGIWHGSSWTFVLWGMIYFVIQAIEKYTDLPAKLKKLHIGHVYTLLIVTLCWVIFRADSVSDAFGYIGNMFGVNCSGILNGNELSIIKYYIVPFAAGIILSSSLVTKFNKLKNDKLAVDIIWHIVLLLLFAVTLIIMAGKGYTAPLYAGF